MKSWSWVVNELEHHGSLSKIFEGCVSLSFTSKSNGAEILFFLNFFFSVKRWLQIQLGSSALFCSFLMQFGPGYLPLFFLLFFSYLFTTAGPATYKQAAAYSEGAALWNKVLF